MNSVVIAVCLLGMIGGCSWLNKKAGLPPDNVIEQNIEALIEYNTGLNIDLTPEDER